MDALNLSELSLFISENVYLIKEHETYADPIKRDEIDDEEQIEIKEPTVPKKKATPSYKPILFLTDEPPKDSAAETFTNIAVKALGLSENDYTLLSQDQVIFDGLDELNSQKIVSFGIPFSGYATKYKNQSLENKLFLYADPLDKIAQNVELKRQLWAQLQLMFPKKN